MAAAGRLPAGRDWEEVRLITMRKLFALAMVMVLATTVALAVVSCGKKAEETSTPAATENKMTDSMGTMPESTMKADTTKKM
jgi:hypothetical protein